MGINLKYCFSISIFPEIKGDPVCGHDKICWPILFLVEPLNLRIISTKEQTLTNYFFFKLSIKGPQLLKIGFQNPNNLLAVSPNNWMAAMCKGMVLLFPLENKKKRVKTRT
jgi:hypothetical protein